METGFEYIERIKEIKKKKGMTNDELSQCSGVPVGTLSKILTGVSDSVKLSNLAAICSALEVSLDYIVFGIEENNNNYMLAEDEITFIEQYRTLDSYSRDFIKSALQLECARNRDRESSRETSARKPLQLIGDRQKRVYSDSDVKRERLRIGLFDLPVSAGTGEYLDTSDKPTMTITVPAGDLTGRADYAVRINGHSMEPSYRDGDILLVEKSDTVEVGEPCIFTLDGCGYFKIFGGDCLISLNPDFGKIMLGGYESVLCQGRVLGKLKKTSARK